MANIITPDGAKPLTEAQERERLSWQYRVIAETKGNSTMLGCLLLAVMGRNAKSAPAMGENAIITTDGIIVTQFLTKHGRLHKAVPIGRVSEIVTELRQLSDKLKLPDDDRVAMFAEMRKWIARDYRATSDPEEWEAKRKDQSYE